MNKLAIAFSFALATAAPAVAQSVGMQVVDAQGGSVGAVAAIQGDNLLVKTDKHEVLLPRASFTVAEGRLLFGMTQAQLNAEVEKTQAQAAASVAAGATVKGLGGSVLGTIEAIDGQNAVIKLTSGSSVSVPLGGLRGHTDGSVVAGVTAEQLEAQLNSAAAPGAGDAD